MKTIFNLLSVVPRAYNAFRGADDRYGNSRHRRDEFMEPIGDRFWETA